jgi:hypothetical protein
MTTPIGTTPARHRRMFAAAALLAVCAAGQAGMASASASFDEQAYSMCTATTIPGPDQTFDTVATACCAENAGVPTPTTYGMGCVKPVDNPGADYRPTIIMPTRPTPPGESDAAFDEMLKQPPAPPLPGDVLPPGDVPLP